MLPQMFNLVIEAAAKHLACSTYCVCTCGPKSPHPPCTHLPSPHELLPQVFNLPIEEAAKHLGTLHVLC
jgi:hypothetical protein